MEIIIFHVCNDMVKFERERERERDREREEYVNYNNQGVKSDKTISKPDNTIGKASKGEEKGHILHTFCGKNQFLHQKKEKEKITLS